MNQYIFTQYIFQYNSIQFMIYLQSIKLYLETLTATLQTMHRTVIYIKIEVQVPSWCYSDCELCRQVPWWYYHEHVTMGNIDKISYHMTYHHTW